MKVLIPFYFGLGNAVMFIPFLRTLRKFHPDWKITILCGMS